MTRRADEPTWATQTVIARGTPAKKLVRGMVLRVRHRGAREESVRHDAPVLRVGSRPGCDLVLDDPAVSRLHFEIVAEDAGFRLRDLGSTNGTFVDGYRARDIYLPPRAVVRAGDSEIAFSAAEEAREVELHASDRWGRAIGRSVAMRELFATLARAAKSDATILLEGESGSGKEVLAATIHETSRREGQPFVVVDAGSMPANLLESLLFGHEKGAFTGATERRIGHFERASGGTLFLDEIGELPLELQPKLLRVLESRTLRRVGSTETTPVDVRIVAATNRDLAEEVNRGAFREDLYYRLAVIRARVPPLRERRDDVRPLVEHFVRRAFERDHPKADRLLAKIDDERWASLEKHPWPGNVRELRNVVERSLALGGDDATVELLDGPVGRASHAEPAAAFEPDLERPLHEQKQEILERFERDYLLAQLARHDGNISRAARASGMERMHFKRMLKKRE